MVRAPIEGWMERGLPPQGIARLDAFVLTILPPVRPVFCGVDPTRFYPDPNVDRAEVRGQYKLSWTHTRAVRGKSLPPEAIRRAFARAFPTAGY